MPTIQYVLNAINRMSGPFNEARQAVEKLLIAEKALQTTNDRLAAAEAKLALAQKTLGASALNAAKQQAEAAAVSQAAAEAAAKGDDNWGQAIANLAKAQAAQMAVTKATSQAVKEAGDNADTAAVKVGVYERASTAASAKVAIATGRMNAEWEKLVHEMNMAMLASRDVLEASDALTRALAGEDIAARGAADGLNKVTVAAGRAAIAQKAVGSQTAAGTLIAGRAYRGWLGLWGVLGRKVNLFGGALQIGLLHLLVDVFAEIVAVVLPAALALGAWGIAATDAIRKVVTQLQNMHTVMDATGQTMHGLSGKMEALHKAVQPEVFQLLGDALLIARAHAGEFAKVVMATNGAIRGLADRLTLALTKGKGFSQFMSNAASDVSKLGEVLGNLGGALGAIIKEMPGFAGVLLNVLVVVSRVIEVIAQGLGVLIKVALIGHGFIIWVGLAATAAKALWTWLNNLRTAAVGWAQKQLTLQAAAKATSGELDAATLAAQRQAAQTDLAAEANGKFAYSSIGMEEALGKTITMQNQALLSTERYQAALQKQRDAAASASKANAANSKSLGTVAVAEDGTAVAAGEAAGATGLFEGAMARLEAVNPAFWAAAVIGGLGYLIYKMVTAKTAAQQFTATLANNLQNTSITDFFHTAAAQVDQLNQRIVESNKSIAYWYSQVQKLSQNSGPGGMGRANDLKYANEQYQAAIQNQKDYIAMSQQTARAVGLFQYRQGLLNKTLGQGAGSMGVLDAAGVTTKQMITNTKDALAQVVIQVQATIAGYKMMGQTGTTLGNDLQVLNRTATDQYKAMQTLNQAWDQFINDVTTTQSSMDTVIQGFHTLASTGQTVREHLGGTTNVFVGMGKAIDGLSKRDVALNQAFTQQVGNLNTMFDSWRTAGLANNLFSKGVKAGIAPLVQYAHGSKEATAQLIALAQEAGYHSPETLKSLINWLGKTGNATQTLKNVADQATAQEALLTSQMGKQGTYIANTLLNDLNQAIVMYGGTKKAVDAYAKAVATQGAQSDAARAARKRLIDDLMQTGHNADWSKGKIAGMISTILQIPYKKALQLVMTGNGSYTITPGKYVKGQVGPSGHAVPPGAQPSAAGGYISGPGTGTSDSIPAWLSNGEYVVKAAAVQKYGTHMMNMINAQKFAAGGLANGEGASIAGNPSVVSGQWVNTTENAFQQRMTASMVAAMRTAIHQAVQKALSVSGFVHPTGSGGSVEALMRSMAASIGWTGQLWTALYDVEMREAGFNLGARNRSSGAYGLAQFINGPSEYYQYGGNPYTAAGQITAMFNYIRGRYGNPLAAWAHELNYGWYDRGGWLQPGLTLARNDTGSPERVSPPGGEPLTRGDAAEIKALLKEQNRLLKATPAATGLAVQGAFTGVTRAAALRGQLMP